MASKRSKRSSARRSVGKHVKRSGGWIIGLAAVGAAAVVGVILLEKKSSAAQLHQLQPVPSQPVPSQPVPSGGGGGGGSTYTAPSDNTGDQTQNTGDQTNQSAGS